MIGFGTIYFIVLLIKKLLIKYKIIKIEQIEIDDKNNEETPEKN